VGTSFMPSVSLAGWKSKVIDAQIAVKTWEWAQKREYKFDNDL